jgi:uncharacterized repeat protein (TIGR02543 family)
LNSVLYSKDGTKLLQYPAAKSDSGFVLDNAVRTIESRAFEGQQNIQSINLSKATKIMDYAFYGAENLATVSNGGAIVFVGKSAFDNTLWLEQFSTANVILGKVYVKYKEVTQNQNISISSSILHIADGAFEGSTITSVTFQNTLQSIGAFAFYNCDSLTSMTIPRNVVEIGEYAFANSTQINAINMLTLYPPRLGYGAFNNESATRKIYLPSLVQDSYEQENDWKDYLPSFDVKTITVNFNMGAAPAYSQTIQIDYYSYVSGLPQIQNGYYSNYTFQGWFLSNQQYINGSIFDVFGDTVTLTAKWGAVKYGITYVIQNGTNHSLNPLEYTFNKMVTFYAPSVQSGYVFDGWYLESDFSGEKIVRFNMGTSGNKTVYAKIVPTIQTAYFDVNDNSEHPAYISQAQKNDVVYNGNNDMPVPTRNGYEFLGWFDQSVGGVQYTNASGEATRPWDKIYGTTLYAHWETECYYIRINLNGSIVWLGGNGDLASESIPLMYGQTFVCPYALALELVNAQSMKTGYKFLYFVDSNGNLLHTLYHTVPDYGTNGMIYTISAKWEKEQHSIYFDSNGGSSVNNITYVQYDEVISLPLPTKSGFNFTGWVVKDNNVTGYPKYSGFDYFRMPDLTVVTQQNGSIGLEATWENESYAIYFDSVGGSSVSPKVVSYLLMPSTYSVPTKNGYLFAGWYDSTAYTNQYATSSGMPTKEWDKAFGTTLYAEWTLENYLIFYNLNAGTNNPLNVETYNIEQTVSLYDPIRDGYEFEGWFDTVNNNFYAHISLNSTGDRYFEAMWYADEYYITNIGGTHTYNSRIVVVDLTNVNLTKSFSFSVGSAVQEITFRSENYSATPINMAITCSFRYISINIRFINIHMKPSANDVHAVAINGYNIGVSLFYSGTNSIIGGNGTSRLGVNEVGEPGAAGIYAVNNYIYISGIGSLTITGGNGGASGKGENGQKGADGNDFGFIIAHGGSGEAGSAGLTGKNGARGGYGIDAAYVGIQGSANNLSIIGGTGGTGGRGGDGGNGGRGGHGGGSILIAMNGGDGGAGEQGGRGGDGGAGGFGISGTYSIPSFCISNGTQGIKGRGGDGGKGGDGGSNGPSSLTTGTHGNGGDGGDGGDPGSGVRAAGETNDSNYIGLSGAAGDYWYAEWTW